jgi:hypothetical protein
VNLNNLNSIYGRGRQGDDPRAEIDSEPNSLRSEQIQGSAAQRSLPSETFVLRVHDDRIQRIFGAVPVICGLKLKLSGDRDSNQSDVREN